MTNSRQVTSFQQSENPQLFINTDIHKNKSTVMQSLITGSLAGAIEVLVNHPLWSIKTRIQCGESFTLKPSIIYRGILANAASEIPITAVQVGLDRCFKNIIFHNSTDISAKQRLASAFVAGAGSSLISSPTELTMTYQAREGGSFYSAVNMIMKHGGQAGIRRGLFATAMRDGIFTAAFIAGTPIFKEKIRIHCKNDLVGTILSGTESGLCATVASQVFDTVKTVQQSTLINERINIFDATRKVYSTNGLYGFFKGGLFRGVRVVSAVMIMSTVTEKMNEEFERSNVQSNLNKMTLTG